MLALLVVDRGGVSLLMRIALALVDVPEVIT